MQNVKEALKRRASGSRGQAAHYQAMAKQLRSDADKHDANANELLQEAIELDRIRVLVYGEDEVPK